MMQVNRVVPSVFNNQNSVIREFLDRPDASTSSHVWQHQIDAVKMVVKQLEDREKPNIALVVLPTGCGKTGVAVLAAYALNASRVLVITPSVKISKQIHEAFCGSQTQRCFWKNVASSYQMILTTSFPEESASLILPRSFLITLILLWWSTRTKLEASLT